MAWLFSKLFWLTVLLMLAYVAVMGDQQRDAAKLDAAYCEAVAQWHQSAGKYGHPAYRGVKVCQ